MNVAAISGGAVRRLKNRSLSMLICVVLIFGAVLAVTGYSQDRAPQRIKERAACTTCTHASLHLELGVGEVSIAAMTTPDSAGVYATADIFFSPRSFRYTWEARTSENLAELDATSDHRPGRGRDNDENDWDILLSKSMPLNLELEIGAADALIDLGGLKLEEVDMEIGAASAEITFLEPNPVRCKEFRLSSGAAHVVIEKFANVNAEQATIEIGAASLDLDLGGKQNGETTLELEVGVGGCDIIVPLDLPLRVEGADDHWFASVDIPRRRMKRVSKGVFETDSFDGAKDRMIINLSVGMGSVDFKFR